MRERLQKLLSRCGVASRREAETIIAAGRVRVNGETAQLGDSADPDTDRVELDGAPLTEAPAPVYLMLHKPRGFLTTLHDDRGRRTVAELVADCGERVYPVGRLDRYSEGLLLLTNDGELAARLTHPRHGIEKVYLVWVSRYIPGAETALTKPIGIGGRATSPAQVRLLRHDGETALLEITLREGRNRQIRRLCERAGLTVTRLRRIREGAVSLGDLPCGKWRYLTAEEIASLKN